MAEDTPTHQPPPSPDKKLWAASHVPTKGTLKKLISSIGPKQETISGIRFYQKLLKQRGPKGLLDTVARFRKMLDEGDGLDLAEMKEHEKAVVRTLAPPIINRHEFLRGAAWGIVGLTALGGSVAKAMHNGYQALTPPAKPEEHPKEHGEHAGHDEGADNHAKTFHEAYEKHVAPYENLIVGAALVNEGIEKWEEIRLRQIKDTVLRMDDLPQMKDALAQRITQMTILNGHKDWAAQEFFQRLLASKGFEAVTSFVQRARKAVDEQNELDLEIDIDGEHWPEERRIFDAIRCNPRHLSPADFLETWGWILPGLICVGEGAIKANHLHIQGRTDESEFIKAMETYVSEPGQMLLGASLVNEFNLNWKEIKLEQIADAVIEMKQHALDWAAITPQELEEIIENMDEPGEKFAGIRFLKSLVKSNGGVEKVKDFLARANVVLDQSSAEDLPHCFTGDEKKIFKSYMCRPNLLDSQNFLHTLGWGLPGVICFMTGAASAADITMQAFGRRKDNAAGKTKHWIHDTFGYVEGLVIGAALVNEAIEKFEEYHFAQISDATAELVDKTSQIGVRYA